MLPIEQSCYWLAQRARPEPTRLSRDERCDIAVVGAGLTGLWTALSLRELAPQAEIAVVESESVGYGASGRNAGMLSETIDHSHALAIRHFGREEAQRLAILGQQNVDEMVTWLQRNQIECDLELTGRLMVALTGGQLAECVESVEVAEKLGVKHHQLLDGEEVRAVLNSPRYIGGVRVAGGGILDPVKLVDGLRAAAERQGVRIFEKSPVRSFRTDANGVVVHGTRGTLHATRAVLATNAYSHHLFPRLLHRFIPLYDYILVSEPVTGPNWTSSAGPVARGSPTGGHSLITIA
jgi:glycine/D-amino acid oxidase-like deaminating enzyme